MPISLFHFILAHTVEFLEALTLSALIWYSTETRLARKEEVKFHRLERRIDFYFLIKRHEEPSKTDMIRFSEQPKPRQADAVATVANVGKMALLLEGIAIQSRDGTERQYPLAPIVLTSGASVEFIVADLIVRYLHETGTLAESMPPERRSWTGDLRIALRFYSRGIMRISEYQRYAIGVTYDAVQTIHLIKGNDDDSPRLTRSALAD
jgi:hypothetical protein